MMAITTSSSIRVNAARRGSQRGGPVALKPEWVQFNPGVAAQGLKFDQQRAISYLTFDYGASVKLKLNKRIGSTSSSTFTCDGRTCGGMPMTDGNSMERTRNSRPGLAAK